MIDSSVVVCARERGHPVVSGDPEDLPAIDPTLSVVVPWPGIPGSGPRRD